MVKEDFGEYEEGLEEEQDCSGYDDEE